MKYMCMDYIQYVCHVEMVDGRQIHTEYKSNV